MLPESDVGFSLLSSLLDSESFFPGRILGWPLSFFRCRSSSRREVFSAVSLLTLSSRFLTSFLSSLTSVSSAGIFDGFMAQKYA